MKNRGRGGFRTLRWLAMACLLGVAVWALEVAAIWLYGQRDEARHADAIVVLGAAQYDGRPSPVLRARLDHAIELYRGGMAGTLIMTGGVGPGDTVSEAVAAQRYAVKQGVPAKAILTERAGMTTLQSMQSVRGMMDQRGLATAVLVSDPFHMLRLKLLALRCGFTGYTSPTPTSPISRNPDQQRRFLLRESFSLPFALVERTR
ncbi:MAG TPA: YdcF family protein [Longimicrobiaceae bacterium]|nr:YdcF family protein [Longimicrobiaceae bacterium]